MVAACGVNILRFLIQSYCYLYLFVCNAVAARFRLPHENVKLKMQIMKKMEIIVLIVGFILVLGLAGRCDYNESVVVDMPEATYKYMRPMFDSESEMVDAYVGREEYWDDKAMGW